MCNQNEPVIYLNRTDNRKTLQVNTYDFRGGESCYYNVVPEDYLGDATFDYHIDLNIIRAEGVEIKVFNGTSYDTAGDLTYVNL